MLRRVSVFCEERPVFLAMLNFLHVYSSAVHNVL